MENKNYICTIKIQTQNTQNTHIMKATYSNETANDLTQYQTSTSKDKRRKRFENKKRKTRYTNENSKWN